MDCLRKMQMSEEYRTACKEDIISTTKRELARYLERHPEMQKHQEQLEGILDTVKPEYKAEVLAILIAGKVQDLNQALTAIEKCLG